MLSRSQKQVVHSNQYWPLVGSKFLTVVICVETDSDIFANSANVSWIGHTSSLSSSAGWLDDPAPAYIVGKIIFIDISIIFKFSNRSRVAYSIILPLHCLLGELRSFLQCPHNSWIIDLTEMWVNASSKVQKKWKNSCVVKNHGKAYQIKNHNITFNRFWFEKEIGAMWCAWLIFKHGYRWLP